MENSGCWRPTGSYFAVELPADAAAEDLSARTKQTAPAKRLRLEFGSNRRDAGTGEMVHGKVDQEK